MTTKPPTPPDEPDAEEPREVARRPDIDRSWETAPDVEDTDLSDVIRQLRRQPRPIDEEQPARLGLRSVPAGFRAVVHRLAREHFVSMSAFAKTAFDVGMDLLDQEPWIIYLRQVYDRVSEAAIDGGRPSAMRRLDRRTSYGFRDSAEYHTTFPVSRRTQARIVELADICGIHASQMGVLAILRALLTLRNNRGYRRGVEEEIETFREFVHHRILELELPNGGRPGTQRALR